MSYVAPRQLLLVRILALLLIGFLALRIAWVSDDALITLRTALNITHGWGAGFNSTEAVQAYTHPLWFLLWIFIGNLSNQWIVGILILSVILTLTAVGVLLWRIRSLPRLIIAVALLAFSNAFMDYSTSGLENPLAYALVSVLLALTFVREWTWRTALLTGLASAAIFLTRFDLALLIAPALLVIAWSLRAKWRLLLIGLGAVVVPVVIWFIWSKATYGVLLPNTFEAKRNLAISATDLASQGLMYLWVSFGHDPASLIAVLLGVVMSLVIGTRVHRAWAIGVLLYLIYVVQIGGDFMSGRFIAVPVLVCVFLLSTVQTPVSASTQVAENDQRGLILTGVALTGVTFLLAGAVAMGDTPGSLQTLTGPRFYEFNIADERGHYSPGRNLSLMLRQTFNKYEEAPKSGDLYSLNVAANTWATKEPGVDYAVTTPTPTYCLFAGTALIEGPLVQEVDPCGLTDRVTASVTYTPDKQFMWRMGHFLRPLPPGYLNAIATRDVSLIEDPELRERVTQLWREIR